MCGEITLPQSLHHDWLQFGQLATIRTNALVFFLGMTMQKAGRYKYLVIVLATELFDDKDIQRQLRY